MSNETLVRSKTYIHHPLFPQLSPRSLCKAPPLQTLLSTCKNIWDEMPRPTLTALKTSHGLPQLSPVQKLQIFVAASFRCRHIVVSKHRGTKIAASAMNAAGFQEPTTDEKKSRTVGTASKHPVIKECRIPSWQRGHDVLNLLSKVGAKYYVVRVFMRDPFLSAATLKHNGENTTRENVWSLDL